MRGDGTFATPTDTNTFRSVTIGGTSIGSSNALDISAGTNVSFGGTAANGDITINAAHPNISAATSVNNTGRTYIQDITLDSNGHITGLTSATETVTDTNTITRVRGTASGTYTSGDLTLAASGATTISQSGSTITISSTDTNTNTQLSNEQVQDIVGGMVSSNDEAGISVVYDDNANKLDFSVTGGVGITQITDGVKMTYPIAIDSSGTGPDANSGFRIAPSSSGGALWFDLS